MKWELGLYLQTSQKNHIIWPKNNLRHSTHTLSIYIFILYFQLGSNNFSDQLFKSFRSILASRAKLWVTGKESGVERALSALICSFLWHTRLSSQRHCFNHTATNLKMYCQCWCCTSFDHKKEAHLLYFAFINWFPFLFTYCSNIS